VASIVFSFQVFGFVIVVFAQCVGKFICLIFLPFETFLKVSNPEIFLDVTGFGFL
jgi:hypothetical protein